MFIAPTPFTDLCLHNVGRLDVMIRKFDTYLSHKTNHSNIRLQILAFWRYFLTSDLESLPQKLHIFILCSNVFDRFFLRTAYLRTAYTTRKESLPEFFNDFFSCFPKEGKLISSVFFFPFSELRFRLSISVFATNAMFRREEYLPTTTELWFKSAINPSGRRCIPVHEHTLRHQNKYNFQISFS